MKKALIVGITGQDGSYLAEFLLSKGYEVHGIIRKASTFNTTRIEHIYQDPHDPNRKLYLHYGDLSDPWVLTEIIYNVKPDEVYNLGAQSHVKVSFELPEYTGNITGLGTTRLLEAIRRSGIKCKFYQASSSEMFGASPPPQNEKTPFQPRSPYAIAKLYSYWMTVNYREAYGIFACNGILFNHESPRRGETFVTRKISRAVANIVAGKQKVLYLGNIYSYRDWGFAPEYVAGMWLMLQQDTPDDFVLGTGVSKSVKEFVDLAFNYVGIDIEWRGHGVEEFALVRSIEPRLYEILKPGDVVVKIDPNYFRPTEVEHLRADFRKARAILGWEPKITFDELVKIMVDYDLLYLNITPPGDGIKISREKGFSWTNHDSVTYDFNRLISNSGG
ncbi:MAG: GDP-mannose 4,6-dehydratase [candidate division WOR-3 bacterium]